MIKQECIGIPDMILLLMIFCFKKIKIKAEIVLSPGGAYFIDTKIGPLYIRGVIANHFIANGSISSLSLQQNGFAIAIAN